LSSLENLLQAHPVTDQLVIAFPETTIQAILPAVIGEFNDAPDMNLIPHVNFPRMVRFLK
jgi:hypothetical protein